MLKYFFQLLLMSFASLAENVATYAAAEISVCRLPVHYIHGDWPTGWSATGFSLVGAVISIYLQQSDFTKCMGIFCFWELCISLKFEMLNGVTGLGRGGLQYTALWSSFFTSLGKQVQSYCPIILTLQKKRISKFVKVNKIIRIVRSS